MSENGLEMEYVIASYPKMLKESVEKYPAEIRFRFECFLGKETAQELIKQIKRRSK